MKRIRQFVELSPRERSLLLSAVVLVATVRLALWTMPFRSARKMLGKRPAVSVKLAAIPVKGLS